MSYSASLSAAAAVASVFGTHEEDGDDHNYPAASKVTVGRLYSDYDDDDLMMHLFSNSENSSHKCAVSAWEKLCCLAYCSDESLHQNAQDKPLWWLVLRWMKMMLFKMIRSYHAKPVILIMIPLLVGLVVGYWLGARRGRQFGSSARAQDSKHNNNDGINMQQNITDIAGRRCNALLCTFQWCLYFVINVLWKVMPHYTTHDHVSLEASETHVESSATISTISQHSNGCCTIVSPVTNDIPLMQREENVRKNLKSHQGTIQESGIPASQVPKHVAVIMDGNRRYGKAKYGSGSRGHWDGSSKLVEFAKWCLAEHIQVLTVFAFSSENWNRDPAEVASLMQIFAKYCDELREEAIQRNIKIVVLSTDYEKIPAHVQKGVKRMVEETQHCDGMIMNICLSYGSRGEMVDATKSVVNDVLHQNLDPNAINEDTLHRRMLTHASGGDPDVLIRTSGEVRISNFLLWQLAYTELFFVDKPWPAMDKEDLLQVIRAYANGRNRRFGK